MNVNKTLRAVTVICGVLLFGTFAAFAWLSVQSGEVQRQVFCDNPGVPPKVKALLVSGVAGIPLLAVLLTTVRRAGRTDHQ